MKDTLFLQNSQTFFFGLRRGALAMGLLLGKFQRLEGGLVGVAAGRLRPGVVHGGRVAAATATAVATAAVPTGTAGLVDPGGRVPQGRTDLVDVEFDDRALLALAGLERTLLEPALDDDAEALVQGLGDVLRRLPPHG